MSPRVAEETLDRRYELSDPPSELCVAVLRDGQLAFLVQLPPDGIVTIGRDAEATLSLSSPSLSRLHLALERIGGETTVRDLGSRNGTLLDGVLIDDAPSNARLGSEIVAGDVKLTPLRTTNLPIVGRPFLLLPTLEIALRTLKQPGFSFAFEFAEPISSCRNTLELFQNLPAPHRVALVSDSIVVVATPEGDLEPRLLQSLVARSVVIQRRASRPLEPGTSAIALLLQALGRWDPEVAEEPAGVPDAFRYPSLRAVHADLRRIAPRRLSVLIRGETGTGKELVARELHRLSGRSGPLVAVNTAALPENLIESELFGHEKGAFSGALATRVGLIEAADGGTLFLDEIGELPATLQAKLLRVLEERTLRRVGATAERKVDLRVVAATHQDLDALAQQKRFRQDLLFRLNGAQVQLPPLRERRGEISALAVALLRELEPAAPPGLDPSALDALLAYAWPGNVRELKHVLERALAFSEGGSIRAEHLPDRIVQAATSDTADTEGSGGDVRATVRDFERDRIMEALREAGGNRTRAAEALGLPRRTLVYKLSKLRLDQED